MERLELSTLGGLFIRLGGQSLTRFDSRKVPALLVYLACTRRACPREVLAEMLWEDRTQSQSLSNLRVALTNLRQQAGPYVEIGRDTAAMHPEADWWLDVSEFERCLSQQQLEKAVEMYQGDFLEGFYIDSQAFEDWMRLERERLRFLAINALDYLTSLHLSQGNYRAGISSATRLLKMDSLREEAHRQMMELLALAGQREASLAQYEVCRRLLADELGVMPLANTTALYERIRAGQVIRERAAVVVTESEPPPAPFLPRPRHNLPAQATSFVGRKEEITAIMDQLLAPNCRLLTLVGPGGMGKTRLALAVADHLIDTFVDGVFFIELVSVTSPEALVSTLAAGLDFRFYSGGGSEKQQLLNYLRGKQMLLVLDNFEHLLESSTALVDSMLSTAPGLTLLVTSRESLGLSWEWLYDVPGLPYPTSGEDALLEGHSAVRLFVERARRVLPGFDLTRERADVLRICQQVQGMPLGIEIAGVVSSDMAAPLPARTIRVRPVERPAREFHRRGGRSNRQNFAGRAGSAGEQVAAELRSPVWPLRHA